MNNSRNRFTDGDCFTEFTPLTHSLNGDNDADTSEVELIEQSPNCSETDFQSLQTRKSRLSLNSQSIKAKFDEFRLFLNRINKVDEIRVVCLQEI